MSFWTAVKLIIANWSSVIRFLELIQKGIDDYSIKKGLERLESNFKRVQEKTESANQARSINDLFR